MNMSVFTKLTTYSPNDIGTDSNIRALFETHRKFLREHADTTIHYVDEGEARPYSYNLYAYLNSQGIPTKLHWVILLISDIRSTEDFTYDTTELMIPDEKLVDTILAVSNL